MKKLLTKPIYQRQPFESVVAWAAFEMYRNIPIDKKRTYTFVADKLQKSLTLIRRWAKDNHWQERSMTFDNYLDNERILGMRRRLIEMDERQAKIGVAMQIKASVRLNSLKAEELTPRDTASFIAEGVKIERLARGRETENYGYVESNQADNKLREAKAFYEEMTLESPDMSESEKESILSEVFDIDSTEFQKILSGDSLTKQESLITDDDESIDESIEDDDGFEPTI